MFVLEIFGWILLSIIKFLFTPSTMIGLGYGFLETFVITASGAAIGVVTFYYCGELFFNWIESKRPYSFPKSKSSRGKRRLIKVKKKFGLRGLVFTCGLISVPLAALLAAKYFRDKKQTMMIMVAAFVCWAFLLTSLSYFIKFSIE